MNRDEILKQFNYHKSGAMGAAMNGTMEALRFQSVEAVKLIRGARNNGVIEPWEAQEKTDELATEILNCLVYGRI